MTPVFEFDNTYARELEGLFVAWRGEEVPDPQILCLNRTLAQELKLDADALATEAGAKILSGTVSPEGAAPLAMAYAGHQFGGFAPALGDGRALLLGEVVDRQGVRRDIHLKGSGRTPFSRTGDGKAPLGPVLREYLVAEAMHALDIPTSRALSATTTGEQIRRHGPTPGAVLARVATSHIRVGTFQFFASRGDDEKLKRLADYTIKRLRPDLQAHENPYLGLLQHVRETQAELIARWMLVGFVHGVMNTDNTTIAGETIDYGPCAFVDGYDPRAVFSSIDHRGRYAYANQPAIGQWNLARFAECLIDLINPDDSDNAIELATQELDAFPAHYEHHWLAGMRAKLGIQTEHAEDKALADDLLDLMHQNKTDFTSLFRALADVVQGNHTELEALIPDAASRDSWLSRYVSRCADEAESPAIRAAAMNQVNPLYIPRNHNVEAALADAEAGDLTLYNALFEAVTDPFEPRDSFDRFEGPAPPEFGRFTTFCGT